MAYIEFAKDYAKLSWKEFQKFHKPYAEVDPMTVRERYVYLGGKPPKEEKEKSGGS